jgi:tRNA (guanosine-2'-O-)-methyltransferase
VKRHDPDVFPLGPESPLPADAAMVVAALSPLITDTRLAKLRSVVAARTRRIIPVLEDIYDPFNASAMLRSSEAFGIQEVAMVRNDREFLAVRKVAKGTHRWLDLRLYEGAAACATALQARGYRVLVARMDGDEAPEDLRTGKVAVVFGNEHTGASAEMNRVANGSYAIPMRGFVESLNVSVAAAITLYTATSPRAGEAPAPGDLSEPEQNELLARFLLSQVRDSTRIVEHYVRSR